MIRLLFRSTTMYRPTTTTIFSHPTTTTIFPSYHHHHFPILRSCAFSGKPPGKPPKTPWRPMSRGKRPPGKHQWKVKLNPKYSVVTEKWLESNQEIRAKRRAEKQKRKAEKNKKADETRKQREEKKRVKAEEEKKAKEEAQKGKEEEDPK